MAVACEMYQGFYGELPLPDSDDTENFEIYEQLQTFGNKIRRHTKPLTWSDQQRNNAGSMIDPWETPYRFKLVTPIGKPTTLRIYSCGPNRKDEDGKGDDILEEIEVEQPSLTSPR